MKRVNAVIIRVERSSSVILTMFDVDAIKPSNVDEVLLKDLQDIIPGQIIAGSGESIEYVLWMGELTDEVRRTFVEYGQTEFEMGTEFGIWFDKAMGS